MCCCVKWQQRINNIPTPTYNLQICHDETTHIKKQKGHVNTLLGVNDVIVWEKDDGHTIKREIFEWLGVYVCVCKSHSHSPINTHTHTSIQKASKVLLLKAFRKLRCVFTLRINVGIKFTTIFNVKSFHSFTQYIFYPIIFGTFWMCTHVEYIYIYIYVYKYYAQAGSCMFIHTTHTFIQLYTITQSMRDDNVSFIKTEKDKVKNYFFK